MKLLATTISLLALGLLCSCTEKEPQNIAPKTDEGARAAFEFYREALAEKDGLKVAQFVNERTFRKFEKLKQPALTAGPAELAQLPKLLQLFMIHWRDTLGVENIKRANGAHLFAYSVEAGFLDAFKHTELEISRVSMLHPDVAEIGFKRTGVGNPPVTLHYKKGAWKINLASLIFDSAEEAQMMYGTDPPDQNQKMVAKMYKNVFGVYPKDSLFASPES